jgi:hypothetical protein
MNLMSFSGAWGKMINEKKLEEKNLLALNLQNHEIFPFPYQFWTKSKFFDPCFLKKGAPKGHYYLQRTVTNRREILP